MPARFSIVATRYCLIISGDVKRQTANHFMFAACRFTIDMKHEIIARNKHKFYAAS